MEMAQRFIEVGAVMLVEAEPPHEDAALETVITAAAIATRSRGIRLRPAAVRMSRNGPAHTELQLRHSQKSGQQFRADEHLNWPKSQELMSGKRRRSPAPERLSRGLPTLCPHIYPI
jgi:hypothetical protein